MSPTLAPRAAKPPAVPALMMRSGDSSAMAAYVVSAAGTVPTAGTPCAVSVPLIATCTRAPPTSPENTFEGSALRWVGGWVGRDTGRRANVCARARAKVRVSTWGEHVSFPCPRARAGRACARTSTHAPEWRRALTLAGVMGSLTDAFSASPSAATKGAASWSIAITKSTVLMGYGRMCARAGGGARVRVSTCVCTMGSPARWRWPARSARCAHA